MKYSFDSRVRYSEIGEDRHLTLNGMINYFQDCSTFHSEAAGVGMEFLAEKQQVWVLSAWQIVVERYPELCEEIKISTWPYEFRHFMGKRNFTMEDKAGNRVAYANTLWTYLDLNTGHPTNVDEKQVEAYQLEEKLDMKYAQEDCGAKRLPGIPAFPGEISSFGHESPCEQWPVHSYGNGVSANRI